MTELPERKLRWLQSAVEDEDLGLELLKSHWKSLLTAGDGFLTHDSTWSGRWVFWSAYASIYSKDNQQEIGMQLNIIRTNWNK